jgi:hypothetical protein
MRALMARTSVALITVAVARLAMRLRLVGSQLEQAVQSHGRRNVDFAGAQSLGDAGAQSATQGVARALCQSALEARDGTLRRSGDLRC